MGEERINKPGNRERNWLKNELQRKKIKNIKDMVDG
jgi:hypothetical protein